MRFPRGVRTSGGTVRISGQVIEAPYSPLSPWIRPLDLPSMRRNPVDMRAFLGCLLCLSIAGLVTACGSANEGGTAPNGPAYTRVASTRGGPIVVTRDRRVAVATNRSAGVVTVFHLDPSKGASGLVTSKTELDMDALLDRPRTDRGSEPWAAVIGVDDDTAYVITRYDGRVTRIVQLHDNPKPDKSVSVGSEPTSIVSSPSGVRLFVANWGEGTISFVTPPHPLGAKELTAVEPKLDLNAALAQAGSLGSVQRRLGLAHPRALAITDDGDDRDDDETL